MSQPLPLAWTCCAFVLFSSFYSSAELVFFLEPRRGEGAGGAECLASGCSLDSEPARGAPCLLRRLLSGRVCTNVAQTIRGAKLPVLVFRRIGGAQVVKAVILTWTQDRGGWERSY